MVRSAYCCCLLCAPYCSPSPTRRARLEGEKEPASDYPDGVFILATGFHGLLYVVFFVGRRFFVVRFQGGGGAVDWSRSTTWLYFCQGEKYPDEQQREKECGTVCGARGGCYPEVEFVRIPTCAAV